ncbi:unnamed protein product [Zymoseptoria tritici ST99CH_1A5]|uniref:Ketoreductase domain-containing protein n=1 Tax=Zymoseptoria tritici ST99CH_1A5 TaxID=1276529 RepID=A0A1Y6LHM7_ZYMTR|nr:unnamed protein product [Zymoseptoria tritici ST99CH_1A5]
MSVDSSRVILITGATGGIGEATAILFAKQGNYKLALHYNSAGQEARDKLLQTINEAGTTSSEVDFFQADLSDYDGVRKLHNDVTARFGGVDVLFNNAGSTSGMTGVQNLADVSIDVFERNWRMNTGSTILLTQLCLPHMEGKGWGRIVFNSSVAAFTGGFVGPHYASSKSAMHGFIYWLGQNVAKNGITVNAVAPALIADTAMMGSPSGEQAKRVAERVPVGRLGQPAEIAETVLWMVKTGYVTRKIIGVDGGVHPA